MIYVLAAMFAARQAVLPTTAHVKLTAPKNELMVLNKEATVLKLMKQTLKAYL
jgi:hypothetical protein